MRRRLRASNRDADARNPADEARPAETESAESAAVPPEDTEDTEGSATAGRGSRSSLPFRVRQATSSSWPSSVSETGPGPIARWPTGAPETRPEPAVGRDAGASEARPEPVMDGADVSGEAGADVSGETSAAGERYEFTGAHDADELGVPGGADRDYVSEHIPAGAPAVPTVPGTPAVPTVPGTPAVPTDEIPVATFGPTWAGPLVTGQAAQPGRAGTLTATGGTGPVATGRAPGGVATISPSRGGPFRGVARLAARPAAARRRASWRRVPGWLFAGVTVLPALLVMAWLLPGLPLLLAGRFDDVPMVVISVPLAVALVFFALRQLPSSWPHGIREIWDQDRIGEAAETEAAEETEERTEVIAPVTGPAAAGPPAAAASGFDAAEPGATDSVSFGSVPDDGVTDVEEAGSAPSYAAQATRAPGAAQATGAARTEAAKTGAAPAPATSPKRAREPQDVPWWALIGTVAVAIGFAVWQVAENSQQYIVLRDPGTYVQFAYWIAQHGSTRIPQDLAAFGHVQQGLSFASLGFYQAGTTVVPQFMAGLPMMLAIGVWATGPTGAAIMAPVFGACAVLAFGGLVGRLAGARWAPAAALVLAVCLPEQYTSRSPFSEPLAQVMLYGGLCLLVDSLVLRTGRRTGRTSWRDGPSPNATLAFLGGLSIGLTLLIRIDGLSDLLPAIPFVAVLLMVRRKQAIPFAVGLIIGIGYGFADGYVLSRPYLDSIGPSLRPLLMIALGVVAVTVIGMGLMSYRRTHDLLRSALNARPLRWLPEAVAVLTVLVVIGFAVRPYFQTVRNETDPATISYVAELQKLAHLPIDPRRQYSEDSLYWVIWYIGVPAVLLGTIGVALLARRCLRAFLTWRDRGGAARIWALPLMIIGWETVTVLWRPGIIPDQPWASRRLVPVILPGLILAAVWMSAWLQERGRRLGASRVAASVVATCCVIALLVTAVVTTFGLGFTKMANGGSKPTAHGLAFKHTGAGEYQAVRGLCSSIGPNASVIIVDSLTADRFSQVIRGMCATPTARMDNPDVTSVQAAIAGILRAGRRPVLLAGQENQLMNYGGVPHQVVNLLTTQDSHELTQPPTGTWLIHFTIWMSQPAGVTGGGVASQDAEYPRRA